MSENLKVVEFKSDSVKKVIEHIQKVHETEGIKHMITVAVLKNDQFDTFSMPEYVFMGMLALAQHVMIDPEAEHEDS